MECINDARTLIGNVYKKEIQLFEKRELEQLWDKYYSSPYYEHIL